MSGYSRQYSRWLAGLSPAQEESYQRALEAAREAAAVQRQVGTQVQCSQESYVSDNQLKSDI